MFGWRQTVPGSRGKLFDSLLLALDSRSVSNPLASPAMALAVALSCLTGCGPGGPDAASTFAQRDSAGVLISVTPGTDARPPLGWEVDSVPDLVIGAGADPSDYLYRVQGVRGFSDGGLLVVDGGRAELRFFDAEGHLSRRAGGEGRGPGEFIDPVLVPSVGGDSLLFFDKRLPRFQVFSRDGQNHRTIRFSQWPWGRVPPVGAMDLRALWEKLETEGGIESAIRVEGPMEETAEYFWFDPVTGEEISFTSFPVIRFYVGPDGPGEIPLSSYPAAIVGPEGALITDGLTSEIREYDIEGRLRRVFRIDESRRPVTREMVEGWIGAKTRGAPASRAEAMRQNYTVMPIPDSLPVFQSLLVDEMGWVWAEMYAWDPAEPGEWMVFDPEGRAHGVVETPPGLEIEHIGRDFILGVRRGQWDVEYVQRHVLDRGVATTAAMKNE